MPVSFWILNTKNYPIIYIKATSTLYKVDILDALKYMEEYKENFMLILDFIDLTGVTLDIFTNFASKFMENKYISAISLIIKNTFIKKVVETVINLFSNPIPFSIHTNRNDAYAYFETITFKKVEKIRI